MAFDIQDYDDLQIYITDGWREWYIPKFRIFIVVDEPICYIYWTDTEKGSSGLTRLLALDYNDVTFGYISPSTAGEVKLQLDIYITSAFSGGGGGTPSAPDGSIQFNDGGSFGGEADLYWDKVQDRLGIGTDTPECTLDVRSGGTTNTRGVQVTHYDNTTAFSQAKFIGRRARGSVGSPSAVQADDTLASFNARGRKATDWSNTVGGFYIYAAESWTDTATGTYITWRGVPTGSTTVAEWMRLNQSGLRLASLAGVGTRMVVADTNGDLSTQALSTTRAITFSLYNGGYDLTTGIQDAPVIIPFAGTVTGWEIMAYDSTNTLISTSCVVDILSDTFANIPLSGTDSIAGSEKPTLSAASTNSDNTITTWSTLTLYNYIQAEIESINAGVARIVISIKVTV
jgi:hypothetical protein